jgi:hypothetical protein
MGAGSGRVMIEEANPVEEFFQTSRPWREIGGQFWAGDACARGRCPGPLHRAAAADCARAEGAGAAVGVATAEIAKNLLISAQILAVAASEAVTAPWPALWQPSPPLGLGPEPHSYAIEFLR